MLAATGHQDGSPSVPVGAGVHTGIAFVGCVGSETQIDFTALGDTVNIAARLSSSAATGETLVTLEGAAAAGLETSRLTRRDLALKGKQSPTSVFALPSAKVDRAP